MSTVSSTDEQLFRKLSNPATVDVHIPLQEIDEHELLEATRVPSPPPSPEGTPVPPQPDLPPPPQRSVFDEAFQSRMKTSPPSVTTASCTPAHVPTRPPPQPFAPAAAMGGRREGGGEDQMLAKQSALLDLDRLRLRGVRLSREFTINDPLEDITFELKRHLAHLDEESSIGMMRDFMRVACTGMEMGATRLGVLDLEGWSAEVCDDIRKYDPALAGLYRKYFRRGTSSPEMQLLVGVVGSMGLFTAKKKFLRTMQGGGRRGGGGGGGGRAAEGGPPPGLAGLFSNLMSGGAGNLGRPPPPPARADILEPGDSDSESEAAPPFRM